ncbi:MAG TPA: hypothetical protein VLA24_03430 [Pseudomonadales bacterium]|nr:hypothetical protein [Pseudomonadales bacterium]
MSNQHWLVRETTIRWLWIGLSVLLALLVAAQFFIEVKPAVGFDGSFGFGAWFGFFSCVAMVIFAKIIGYVVKRSEFYYSEDDNV